MLSLSKTHFSSTLCRGYKGHLLGNQSPLLSICSGTVHFLICNGSVPNTFFEDCRLSAVDVYLRTSLIILSTWSWLSSVFLFSIRETNQMVFEPKITSALILVTTVLYSLTEWHRPLSMPTHEWSLGTARPLWNWEKTVDSFVYIWSLPILKVEEMSGTFKLLRTYTDRFIRISVGLGMGGLFMYKSAADVFPHKICKDVKGLKEEGDVDAEIPVRCRVLFNEVAKKFGFKPTDKISLFVNKEFHAISAGSTFFPSGAVLGLPRWYLYETVEDVKNSGIKFKGADIDWNSELGVTVKECFLPTEDMIAFTIGHELAHIQRVEYKLLEAFATPLWLYLTFKLANVTRKLFKLNPLLDISIKLCFCGVSYLLYNIADQKLCHASEFNADELSAKCDPRMARGGIAFFSNRQKLNLILRKLHGTEGEGYFTDEGDEIKSFHHPKLTKRLERVVAIFHSTANEDFVRNWCAISLDKTLLLSANFIYYLIFIQLTQDMENQHFGWPPKSFIQTLFWLVTQAFTSGKNVWRGKRWSEKDANVGETSTDQNFPWKTSSVVKSALL